MSKLTINRRTCLRGALGGIAVSIGLPPLDAMFNGNGTAYASGAAIPKRLASWFWAQGVTKEWFPIAGSPQPYTQGGKQVGTVDATWTAPSELQPFEKAGLRNDISVITGSRLFGWSEVMHSAQDIGVLSGYPTVNTGCTFCVGPTRPSILEEVSTRWHGDGSPFPFLAAGVTGTFSPTGLPHEASPTAMFDRVFGAASNVGVGPSGLSIATRSSVLDLVREESATLSKSLGARDSQRIQAFQQSIRDLETRMSSKTNPGAAADLQKLTRPMVAKNDYDATHDAFARIMAIAVATNQTRVLSVTVDAGQSEAVYSNIGLKVPAGAGYHSITHMDKSIAIPAIHEVTLWKMQKLAQFIGYLKAVPEGAGTLLDNCLVFASSEMDDATTHFCINTPMILAGKSGGALKNGLYYAGFVGKEPYANGDNDTNQESTTKILLTILRALGEKDTQWGQRSEKNGPAITDPFGALLA